MNEDDIKYPGVEVQLIGESANAGAIIGRVRHALKDAGVSPDEQTEFMREAMGGDYNHVLQTVMAWVSVY